MRRVKKKVLNKNHLLMNQKDNLDEYNTHDYAYCAYLCGSRDIHLVQKKAQ
jgi:hypothetical protein